MNLSQATLAKSDQLNADDLVSGPRTFTVAEVRRGDADQPVAIVLAEFPANRPFKPSKTVIRALAFGWGEETDDWPERPRFTLYRDASVKWAGQEVGGIRVSAMSHIDKHPDLKNGKLKIALTESKGKKSLHVVECLPASAPTTSPAISPETLAELTATFERKGSAEDKRLAWVNHITGGSATAIETITEDQARVVLAKLQEKPDVQREETPYDPTNEPGWGEQQGGAE